MFVAFVCLLLLSVCYFFSVCCTHQGRCRKVDWWAAAPSAFSNNLGNTGQVIKVYAPNMGRSSAEMNNGKRKFNFMFLCKNMLQMIYHSIVCYCYCTHGIVEPIWDKSASYTISTNVCNCLRKTFAHPNRCRWSFVSYESVSFLPSSNVTPVNCKGHVSKIETVQEDVE